LHSREIHTASLYCPLRRLKPAQILEHSGPDSNPIEKVVHEIVYRPPPDEIESIEDMPQQPLEITFVRSNGNGSGGLNEDTARTKR
jgi:hypothetical protein